MPADGRLFAADGGLASCSFEKVDRVIFHDCIEFAKGIEVRWTLHVDGWVVLGRRMTAWSRGFMQIRDRTIFHDCVEFANRLEVRWTLHVGGWGGLRRRMAACGRLTGVSIRWVCIFGNLYFFGTT